MLQASIDWMLNYGLFLYLWNLKMLAEPSNVLLKGGVSMAAQVKIVVTLAVQLNNSMRLLLNR